MDRINGAGHVGHMFVAEDVPTNRPPTEVTNDWLNAIQEELAALPEGAGMALDPNNNTQVREAVRRMIDGAQKTGFRNRIINGDMRVNQRGNGAGVAVIAGTANQFMADRMMITCGGGNITAQCVAGTGAYTYDVLLTGAASVTSAAVRQRIEAANAASLKNKTVTVQAELSSSTAAVVMWSATYANSPDNFISGVTAIAGGALMIGPVPEIKSFSFNVGANAGNGIQVVFDFGALGAGETGRISGIQLEEGSVASPFEVRQYGLELALCQRYYETGYYHLYLPVSGTGYSGGRQPYKAVKRTVPTLTIIDSVGNVGKISIVTTGAGGITHNMAYFDNGSSASEVSIAYVGGAANYGIVYTFKSDAEL